MSNNAKYTVKFPLQMDITEQPGYDPIGSDSLHELVNFNIKNVLMTNKGERTWDGAFGVGLNLLLFEQFDELELDVIETEIRGQIDAYVPYIYLNEVSLIPSPNQETFVVKLRYTIAQVNTAHVLDLAFGSSVTNAGALGKRAFHDGKLSDRLIGRYR